MAIEVVAQTRKQQGTGASRRLRLVGKVPGIVYGGKKPAVTIEIDHNGLFHQLRNEKFHASILTLTLDNAPEPVLLRAVNMHPWKLQVQHIDFQRVSADEKIHMKVPLHFANAEISPAVKVSGGIVSHIMNELDIRCLPADLPEFIEVDLSELTVGHSMHVRDLALPKGVELSLKGTENPPVAAAQIPKVLVAEEEAVGGEAAEAAPAASEVPTVKQQAKPEGEPVEEKKGGKGEKKAEKTEKK
ncbi:MAG: 50S ribosomal protein L25/general stress protein Ctc [Betaproteobacteria bacterium RBG_16_64_18]|nr:MAG: 50S ribosomal protein L25/general stress protein Ctc [Betaproteobacteria bacterium RBG_16_64_18]OGA10399.1 MAG: 50S ribosomal protein L25/general stress protein Ctc [Betaproteobacteria bacterium RIFCSPLOWO2_02_FULL_65_20]OGA40211.1 MAG: 50S ribosomal protein L25/general stress protein Ctc [Betaproteobacteria bacterium RIFCSPLOWO2_12_FULL_65_110]